MTLEQVVDDRLVPASPSCSLGLAELSPLEGGPSRAAQRQPQVQPRIGGMWGSKAATLKPAEERTSSPASTSSAAGAMLILEAVQIEVPPPPALPHGTAAMPPAASDHLMAAVPPLADYEQMMRPALPNPRDQAMQPIAPAPEGDAAAFQAGIQAAVAQALPVSFLASTEGAYSSVCPLAASGGSAGGGGSEGSDGVTRYSGGGGRAARGVTGYGWWDGSG